MKIIKPVLISILSISIVACAGKTAHPVASYRAGDEDMSCPQLKAEMAHVDMKVAELVPQSEKTGKNVALGVAGWFLIVPWFFMDLSDAEKVEIEAYKERYLALQKAYSEKSCSKEPSINTAQTDASKTTSSESLAELKDLHSQGFITDQEYQEQRRQIIDGI